MLLLENHRFISIYFTTNMTSQLEIDTKSCHTNFSLFPEIWFAAAFIHHTSGSVQHLLMLRQIKQAECMAILPRKTIGALVTGLVASCQGCHQNSKHKKGLCTSLQIKYEVQHRFKQRRLVEVKNNYLIFDIILNWVLQKVLKLKQHPYAC